MTADNLTTLDELFRVTLLGTGAPPPRMDRFGPSTLVEVGDRKFIFVAGRGPVLHADPQAVGGLVQVHEHGSRHVQRRG